VQRHSFRYVGYAMIRARYHQTEITAGVVDRHAKSVDHAD
jgi:hypothetical protein